MGSFTSLRFCASVDMIVILNYLHTNCYYYVTLKDFSLKYRVSLPISFVLENSRSQFLVMMRLCLVNLKVLLFRKLCSRELGFESWLCYLPPLQC